MPGPGKTRAYSTCVTFVPGVTEVQVSEELVNSIEAIPEYELLTCIPAAGGGIRIEARFTTPSVGWWDLTTIHLMANPDGVVVANMTSKCTSVCPGWCPMPLREFFHFYKWYGDFGQNRKHLAQIIMNLENPTIVQEVVAVSRDGTARPREPEAKRD